MIECDRVCRGSTFPAGISSKYSRIAFSAAGWIAVYFTDTCVILTLLGVCVTYLITFTMLLQEVNFNPFTAPQLTIIASVLVFPLSLAKDVSALAKFSLGGLFVLLVGVVVIFGYGIIFSEKNASSSNVSYADLPLFPSSWSGLGTYLGVATFCFGIASIAFPVEVYALLFVFCLCCILFLSVYYSSYSY